MQSVLKFGLFHKYFGALYYNIPLFSYTHFLKIFEAKSEFLVNMVVIETRRVHVITCFILFPKI